MHYSQLTAVLRLAPHLLLPRWLEPNNKAARQTRFLFYHRIGEAISFQNQHRARQEYPRDL